MGSLPKVNWDGESTHDTKIWPAMHVFLQNLHTLHSLALAAHCAENQQASAKQYEHKVEVQPSQHALFPQMC